MALVVCLMIMVVMALIATGVTTNSTVEIKISGNQRNKAISFNNAEVGINISPQVIKDNLSDYNKWISGNPGWDSSANAFLFLVTSDNDSNGANDLEILVNEVTTGTEIDFANPVNSLAININGEYQTSVTIRRIGVNLATGNAIQMAAGYEGIGKGISGGGFYAYYQCISTGTAYNNTSTTNESCYAYKAGDNRH